MNNSLMLLGLVLGLVVGLLASFGADAGWATTPFLEALALGSEPLGDLFIRALQMIVIPLVMAIVFGGVARLGDARSLGRLGGTALAFIFGTTLVGVLTGMGGMGLALQFVPPVPNPAPGAADAVELPGIVDFLVNLVPANPFAAASAGRLLPLLVFSILFGAAAGTLPAAQRDRLLEIADAVEAAFIRLVHWILWTAPVGIFGLAAPAAARLGLDLLGSLAALVGVVIVGLFVFMTLVYLPLVATLGRTPPGRFIRGTLASYTMGFTTTSSVATLPILLRDAPALGVSERVKDLVIPLAASMNRAGSGLFQGASVVFLAWLYQVPVPGGAWGGAVLACFFAAATVAPVPSASIMTLAPALDAVGVPLAGLGILLGVDRVPDMFRSATNMTGHMAAAVVVEGVVGEGTASVGAVDDLSPRERTAAPET
ncbi:MAG TPA: dicarboxylate/amino acid:cation symporter [Longimicrobiales bacterium]|nr:dicarboxylate/amino acid:cation symporter [Longimicrobiales bacterium]